MEEQIEIQTQRDLVIKLRGTGVPFQLKKGSKIIGFKSNFDSAMKEYEESERNLKNPTSLEGENNEQVKYMGNIRSIRKI